MRTRVQWLAIVDEAVKSLPKFARSEPRWDGKSASYYARVKGGKGRYPSLANWVDADEPPRENIFIELRVRFDHDDTGYFSDIALREYVVAVCEAALRAVERTYRGGE